MPIPVKNDCSPDNVFGGFNQTLFLGCSVSSFSGSAGWNEQQSEITVQIVEDTCAPPVGSPKKYFNTSLVETDWTLADPGFYGLTTLIIGAPVYFRVGNFEFSGIIQSWEEINAQSGNPTYQVKIVDPRGIIENAQVIINEYAGGVLSQNNIINAFGFMETLGVACPEYYQSAPGVYSAGSGSADGSVFGSPAGFYGGADVNDNGMQWNQILSAQRILLGAIPPTTNIWSPLGRLAFKSPTSIPTEGMGLMPADVAGLAYYYLDLEEVPVAPSYWRLNGTNVSVLEALSQVTQDSGHDFYIELMPVVDAALGAGIHKFIKIRTADRFAAPALNSIDSFIGAAGREVISYNKGRELRNEITQSFVIGGPKNSVYQAEQSTDPEGDGQPAPPEADDLIVPFFGLNPTNSDVILPELDGDGWWFYEAYTDDLALQLASPKYARGIAATVTINEKELIAAQSGFDSWMSYSSFNKTDLWNEIGVAMAGIFDIAHVIDAIKNLAVAGNKMRPADLMALRANVFQPKADAGRDFEVVQVAFAWIEKIATEYYGKKYMVRVPFTCGRTDAESDIIQLSEQPTDSGWTEVTPVIGLTHPSAFTDFFTMPDNRLGAFSRFDNADGLEISSLNMNEFVSTGGKAWIKIGVEDEYQYLDKGTLFSPRAIITLPQTIREIENNPDVQQGWNLLVELLTTFRDGAPVAELAAKERIADIVKRVGNKQMHFAMVNRAEMPDACAFGVKSNILTYGPWGAAGAVGGVAVKSEDGLVPWEYGGFTTLDLAGNATATEGISNQQVSEEGSVTIAGYPELPMGSELLAADTGGPFAGASGNNLVENRTGGSGTIGAFTYYFTPIGIWDGTYGPNVTGLTTQVGPEGLTTTYNMRTWTPKWGRFFKGNAERLKKVGQQRLNAGKQMRAFALQRLRRNHLNNLAGQREGINVKDGVWQEHSPHELLMGEIIPWNNSAYDRPLVGTLSALDAPVEMAEEYGNKAWMSLDGLLRPISMDGSGGLSQYGIPTSNCQKTSSRGSQPPIDKEGEAGTLSQYNTDIDVDYLNPFTNPSTKARSKLASDYTDTPSVGHDIEMVGRGTGLPPSSVVMPIQGYVDSLDTAVSDHEDDYRPLALRGPLLLKGWGYDLDGFPIPNKVDTASAAAAGTFDGTDLQLKFMDDHLRKSESWPVGPVDLRWDRARAVWTVPQFRQLIAVLDEDIDPLMSGKAKLTSGPVLYDVDGGTISNPEFIVFDRVGHKCMKSGSPIIAEFDPYSCEYSIVEVRDPSIDVTLGTGCITQNGPIPEQICSMNLRDGLRAKTNESDPCVMDMGAGIDLFCDQACVTGCDDVPFINKLKLGKGLNAEADGVCTAKIGAGIDLTWSDTCVTGQDAAPFINNLDVGKGLNLEAISSCNAKIGLAMTFGGVSNIAEVVLGDDLTATSMGSCVVKLDVTHPDPTGLIVCGFENVTEIKCGTNISAVPIATGCIQLNVDIPTVTGLETDITVVTSMSHTCCDNGGFKDITATTKVMSFNPEGRLVDLNDGTPIFLECECPMVCCSGTGTGQGSGSGGGSGSGTGATGTVTGCGCCEGQEPAIPDTLYLVNYDEAESRCIGQMQKTSTPSGCPGFTGLPATCDEVWQGTMCHPDFGSGECVTMFCEQVYDETQQLNSDYIVFIDYMGERKTTIADTAACTSNVVMDLDDIGTHTIERLPGDITGCCTGSP